MFSNPFPNAFGIDFGDLSIKFVQLANKSMRYRKAAFNFVMARSIRLPQGLIVDGEIRQPDKVAQYVKRLLQGEGKKQKAVKSNWLVASLPEPQSFIKLIKINKKKEEIFEVDVREAIKKHLPFDSNQKEDIYYLDWQVVPSAGSEERGVHVLVGAVPKKIADEYIKLFDTLGLNVVALEIEALSIARAMITASKKYIGEARAILDIGAARSSLIVYDYDVLQFSTSLHYSGEMVTNDLADKLGITHDEAEKIKVDQGLNYSSDSQKYNKKAWETMSASTDDLAKQIEKAINFYYSHFPKANKINHITMCGSASAMKKLAEVLTHKLQIEAKPGRVWKNLSTKKGVIPNEVESLGFATAIGLSLRAADNPYFRKDII